MNTNELKREICIVEQNEFFFFLNLKDSVSVYSKTNHNPLS